MAPATPKDSSALPGLLLLLAAATFVVVANAQLSENYYGSSCPATLLTIRTVVTTAVLLDHRMGASLLRLHFHDCFVQASPWPTSLPRSLPFFRAFISRVKR
jgi:peroxidase